MILIISKKNDLVSYGFYRAFRTIYKDVKIIYNEKQMINLDYKTLIINNFDFFDKIPIKKEYKYILINENCLFENKLKNININYLIIKEYSTQYDLTNFKKIDNYMYISNNIILMPYCSIFTKNEILWHYKKKIIIQKKIPNKVYTYDNIRFTNELIKIDYIKNNNKNIEEMVNNLFNYKNIYITDYDKNKLNYKSISYMALGNYTMTNSNLNEIFYTFNIGKIDKVDFNKIVQNIELIYNDFTFEKYVKILNNYFLSVV